MKTRAFLQQGVIWSFKYHSYKSDQKNDLQSLKVQLSQVHFFVRAFIVYFFFSLHSLSPCKFAVEKYRHNLLIPPQNCSSDSFGMCNLTRRIVNPPQVFLHAHGSQQSQGHRLTLSCAGNNGGSIPACEREKQKKSCKQASKKNIRKFACTPL